MAGLTSDVVVIGGGIIGCSTAYYLAKAGVKVTLVERRGIASEASGANIGQVSLGSKEPGTIFWHLARESQRLFPGLDDELGGETEYQQVGAIAVHRTPEALESGRQLAARQQAVGLKVSLASPEDARVIEPAIDPNALCGLVFYPTDGVINPIAVTVAFARAAVRLGARLLCPATVTGITLQHGAVAAVETDQGTIATRTAVNAAGAWASQIGRFVGLDVPVTPCRGQVLVTERMPRRITRAQLAIDPLARQTKSGTILIGSSPEFVGYDKRTDAVTTGEFARDICDVFPFLREAQIVRTWAGLRPATADGLPFLGGVEEVPGFVLAAGHFRSGMGMGPGTGKVIADLITGRPLSFPLEGCGLDRLTARV